MAGRWTIIVMPVILFAAALISMLWFQGQAVTHAQEHTFETLRISAQDQTLIFNDRLEKQFDVLSVLALSLSQNEDISADALYSLLRETGGLTNFRDILVARADGVAYASDGTIVFIGDMVSVWPRRVSAEMDNRNTPFRYCMRGEQPPQRRAGFCHFCADSAGREGRGRAAGHT